MWSDELENKLGGPPASLEIRLDIELVYKIDLEGVFLVFIALEIIYKSEAKMQLRVPSQGNI